MADRLLDYDLRITPLCYITVVFAVIIFCSHLWFDAFLPSAGERSAVYGFPYLQEKLATHLQQALPDGDAGALACAMLLGKRDKLPDDMKQEFRDVGASHLLALSGLHLGLLVGLLNIVLLRTLGSRLLSGLVVIISLSMVWGYAALTLFPVSLVRASVMTTVYFLAQLRSHGSQPLHNLSLAALVLLLVMPSALFDVGFQLSFAAVLGIILLLRPLQSIVPNDRDVLRAVWTFFAVGIAAQLGTAPLVAYYFHQLPLVSFVIGPAFILVTYLFIFLVIMAVLGVPFAAPVATWLIGVQRVVMRALTVVPNLTNLHPSAFYVAMMCLSLFIFGYALHQRYHLLRRWYWPACAILCLIAGTVYDIFNR